MNNPKVDAALNLSLSLPESLHEKSTSLSAVLTGSVWEILVLASQDLSFFTDGKGSFSWFCGFRH